MTSTLHVEDTLDRWSRAVSAVSAVETLVHEIPERVAELRAMGCPVRRRPGRSRVVTRRRRIAHVAGAETGRAITQVLVDRVRADPRITIADGRACPAGGAGLRMSSPTGGSIAAPAIVLATGGYAALWSRTSNPRRLHRRGPRHRMAGRRASSPTWSSCSSIPRSWRARGCCSPRRCVGMARTLIELDGLALHRRAGATRCRGPGGRRPPRRAPGPAARRPAASSRRSWTVSTEAGYLPDTRPDARSSPRPTSRWAASSPTSTARPASAACMPPGSAPTPGSTAPTGWPPTRSPSASSSAVARPSPRSPTGRRPASGAMPRRGRSRPPGLDEGPELDRGRARGDVARRRAHPGRGRARDALLTSHVPLIRMVAASALVRVASRGAATTDPTSRSSTRRSMACTPIIERRHRHRCWRHGHDHSRRRAADLPARRPTWARTSPPGWPRTSGAGDRTTEAVVPARRDAAAPRMLLKEPGVVCGLGLHPPGVPGAGPRPAFGSRRGRRRPVSPRRRRPPRGPRPCRAHR